MKLIKQIAPARQIDAVRSFAAQSKEAFIAEKGGEVFVTIMQTNSNGLDCRWTAANKDEAIRSLLEAGYEIEAAA